jgi:hypothetical protein
MELIGNDSGLIAVLLGLVLFGCGYAVVVAWLGRRSEGFVSLLVVLGTLVTLSGAGLLIGMKAVMVVLACFAASGLPMIVGDVVGYVRRRERDRKELLGRIADDQTTGVAEWRRGNTVGLYRVDAASPDGSESHRAR